MIDEIDYATYDDTDLLYEEKTEKYYLDKKLHVGVMLPPNKWHETEIEKVMPDGFIYENYYPMFDSDDFEWKLTYQFSSDFRNPRTGFGQYGNREMTYRRLYIILCEHFNRSYFIDDYFATVYPATIKSYVEERLQIIKDIILEKVDETARITHVTKENKLDMRYKLNRELMSIIDEFSQSEADSLAEFIKEDIKSCLITGIMPVNFTLSPITLKIREELGIASSEPLYATGQLISDLRIFFRLEKRQWRTRQNILV